ncbi:substrate-binding periplasmic protein [Undibacterium fentianense]|uniref:Transporter substrate-binding domain-containing protein n=1 Tax=Undibacterium fentianense TaxID=2828728 RepID=A0A941IEJ5_9BURK|nr:transporter substrate-binding domain-containing protein [Undibacterium fentianense]MBR7799457.1 transporter substrate-binding domain-containing protein [Undibacterium fentianense]
MTKVYSYCILFCMLCLSMATAGSAHAQTAVTLYIQENLDVNGSPIPPDQNLMELINYFERTTNLQFNKMIVPWRRAQYETLQGNGIIYGLSRNPDRLSRFHYSQAVASQTIWAITYGKPKPKYKTIEDLRGKVISVGRGFSHGMEFEQARDIIFKVEEDASFTTARFNKLINKTNDLILWPLRVLKDQSEVETYINQVFANYSGFKDTHFDVSDQPLFYDTEHFASAKGKFEDIIAKIDKAIVEGKKSGELSKLLRAYR